MTTTVISESVAGSGPLFEFAGDGDALRILEGVTVEATSNSYAVTGREFEGLQAVIDGTIRGGNWSALDLFESSADVTVSATGSLESPTGAMAYEVSYESALVNSGVISALRGFGVVHIAPTGNASIINHGQIFGEVGGVEAASYDTDTAIRIENHGTIDTGSGENDTVYGSGSNQAVYTRVMSAEIVNTGTITANDRQGAGIQIDGYWTVVWPKVEEPQFAGLDNSGTILSSLNWGVSTVGFHGDLQLSNSGRIEGARGALRLSDSADHVSNSGTLDGRVDLGAGDDTFHGETGRVEGIIYGRGGNDLILVGLGSDEVRGGSGDDTISGGGQSDEIHGGGGSDWVTYGEINAAILLDLGADLVSFPGRVWLPENIHSIENAMGGAGNDTLKGDAGENCLDGGSGRDLLRGGGGDDSLYGGRGRDNLYGGAGNDTLDRGRAQDLMDGGSDIDTVVYQTTGSIRADLQAGTVDFPYDRWASETLVSIENAVGGDGSDTLLGTGSANLLDGGAGGDDLVGKAGDDTLLGGLGYDRLNGGEGRDDLIGGPESDTFEFASVLDSTPDQYDRILAAPDSRAFDWEDQIDVSRIDADTTTGGNQALRFGDIGETGAIWAEQDGEDIWVRANTDADAGIEFAVLIHDTEFGGFYAEDLTAINFVL